MLVFNGFAVITDNEVSSSEGVPSKGLTFIPYIKFGLESPYNTSNTSPDVI
jgi:hypothetical protein